MVYVYPQPARGLAIGVAPRWFLFDCIKSCDQSHAGGGARKDETDPTVMPPSSEIQSAAGRKPSWCERTFCRRWKRACRVEDSGGKIHPQQPRC